MSTSRKQKVIDLPTLIAISIIAWVLVNSLHEIVGHAGAAVLLGHKIKAVSTTTAYMDANWNEVYEVQGMGPIRLFVAGGTVVNFITGAFALLILSRRKVSSVSLRYFLWLFATFSAIIVSANLVSAPLIGGGDWTEFINDLEPRNLWKIGLIIVGIIVAVMSYILPLRLWMPRLKGHRWVQLTITAIPVVTLIIVQTLSLLDSPFSTLPPASNHLLASVFAYLHFGLWALLVNVIPGPRSTDSVESIHLPRSYMWLVFGLGVFIFFTVVLGPGIGSFAGHPALQG